VNIKSTKIIAFKQGVMAVTFFHCLRGWTKRLILMAFGPKPGGIDHVAFNDLALLKDMSDNTCAGNDEPLPRRRRII